MSEAVGTAIELLRAHTLSVQNACYFEAVGTAMRRRGDMHDDDCDYFIFLSPT
jgi:hypothetical protein